MIGLLFLAGAALWLTVAFMLSRRIPRWVGITKHAKAASMVLFPLILVAPVADELIGRWQFHRLCEREAVVTLSPDWRTVKAARDNDPPVTEIAGYAFRSGFKASSSWMPTLGNHSCLTRDFIPLAACCLVALVLGLGCQRPVGQRTNHRC